MKADKTGGIRQEVRTGSSFSTDTLDAITTEEIINFKMVAEKITVQSTGTLEGTVEISVNGVDFTSQETFAANAVVHIDTTLVSSVKVTRTGGTGRLVVLVK